MEYSGECRDLDVDMKKAANRVVNCLIYRVTPERLELSTQ